MTIAAQRHVFIAALVARKIAGRGKYPDDAVKIELFDGKEELIFQIKVYMNERPCLH